MSYKKILPECRYCEQPIEDATCYCVDLDCEWDTLLHEECYKKVRDAIKVEPIRDLLDDTIRRVTTPEKELLPDWDITWKNAADIVVNRDIQSAIEIKPGDTFGIYVNGNLETVSLKEGTYNRSQFKDMLNKELAGKGVEAYLSGNKLGYRTTTEGSGTSISMNYADGGSSMKAIYGETTTEYPAVKVSFDSNKMMTLSTPSKPNSKITVNSANGGAFQKPDVQTTPAEVYKKTGYHSDMVSYIDGVDLDSDIIIDAWNERLDFLFTDNGSARSVTLFVPRGKYTYDTLQQELQKMLDDKLGSNKIKATVSSSGVRLETVKTGTKNKLNFFSGNFYDKVICLATERTEPQEVKSQSGEQVVDSAFTVGRKNVRDVATRIRGGISDEFSLELSYGNTTHVLNMKLDDGEYSAEELKKHLQKKLNEQLVAKGLPENLIEVGIGGINTNVSGSNDDAALNFSLSKTIPAPGEGNFIIDGVKGNAAFEIFYQTDGSLEQAYLVGTKNVEAEITIPPDETELSVSVDGTQYNITLREGEYNAQELKEMLKDAIQTSGAPINAEISDGKVKLIHKKMGEHKISNVSGPAVPNMFFSENGKKQGAGTNYVKLSSSYGDSIDLDKPVFNTCSMKINSVCISQIKNANKALDRLNAALQYVSDIRSAFGSTQNRLEHAVRNNENKEENLQASESKIRDTDMAKEMVALSNHNILQQAGQAMLAQAKQTHQRVLALLQ